MLNTILPSIGQNQHYGNNLLYKTYVISIMVSHFDHKRRCLIEKNVPIVLILPIRWQYGAESLGIEHTSCLCLSVQSAPPLKRTLALAPIAQNDNVIGRKYNFKTI